MPLTPPDFLRPLLARPVAVFGAGVSGEGVGELLGRIGASVVVYDAKGVEFTAGAAAQHSLVVFSPGFAPGHAWLEAARAAGLTCLGETDFAALFWRGPIVAVTGTNGKTTLTEFLTHALRAIGQAACATGNIGHPLSRAVAENEGGAAGLTAVCEVSSFQAETLGHLQPEATIWINFAEDHLDRHPDMEAYCEAKWKLLRATKEGRFLVGSSVGAYADKTGRALPPEARVASENLPADPGLAGTAFAHYPQRENFVLAAEWWKRAGFEPAALYQAARNFRLARHRMTEVAAHAGVIFWNDSKATNFHAVEAALQRFARPVILIAGGKAKGGDIPAFVGRIAPAVKRVFLIGETRDVLARACAARGVSHLGCGSLEEAVQLAVASGESGDNILLSPGFASFDMFRNYQDRGDRFERLVRDFIKTSSLE